jgi:hypothetical protein
MLLSISDVLLTNLASINERFGILRVALYAFSSLKMQLTWKKLALSTSLVCSTVVHGQCPDYTTYSQASTRVQV